jgi:hypothetical protein
MARASQGFANITREHVDQACRELVRAGTVAGGGSYFVAFNGKELPAKRVVREAYQVANGREIGTNEFSGGEFCERILTKLGVTVIKKPNG